MNDAIERFASDCCLDNTMGCRNRAGVMKRKMIAYLIGIFIAVQIAARIDDRPESNETVTAAPASHEKFSLSSRVNAKLAAFKKTGVGKEIKTNGYDVDDVIEYAESLIGTPHVMGGYSSRGVDCSGLVKLAHEKAEVSLPRSSHDQARYGEIIPAGEKLKRGDIVFFHSTYKKNHLITHTGIYIGNNQFIHASSSRGVTISRLFDSGYYQKHYLCATRLSD